MATNDDVDFTRFFADTDRPSGALCGLRVGIKDLFDVAGQVTRGGSRSREQRPAATRDAEAVSRLRLAGATLVGHNNMTEFAYSGLGLNPHHGTPMTPLIEGAIAGGSTSGGASAVARGSIDIALGTDTGGSLRIPAAFCGVVGLKPTAAAIPSDGALALSHTLDSVGPMARDVATIRRAFDVLSPPQPSTASAGSGTSGARPITRLIVPHNFGMDELDAAVRQAFDQAVATLEVSGYHIERRALDFLHDYQRLPVWHFSAVESRVHHAREYAEAADQLDPRVRSRMTRADTVSAVDYANSLVQRQRIVQAAREEIDDAAILLPTVAILPPSLSALADDETYNRINLLALRNTTLANVCDGCSISLPIRATPGTALMLSAPAWRDRALLDAAERIEPLLS